MPLHIRYLIAVWLVLVLSSSNASAQVTALFNTNAFCSNTQGYIASSIVCEFIYIVNHVLTNLYNGLRPAIIGMVQAVLTLYVAVFGAQILMGTAELRGRDIITRLFKIAAVWLFSTQSDYAIGVTFTFFMGLIAEANALVVNTLSNMAPICNTNLPDLPDGGDPANAKPLFVYFDQLILCAISGQTGVANTKIFGFFMAVSLAYPPMSLIFTWWVQTTLFALARTIMSFLTSVASIAFLVSLTPIFMCLMLFQITKHYFDNWLKYMISYAVQIILVFGIVVLWIMVILQLVAFFTVLSDLIYPYQPQTGVTPTMVMSPIMVPLDTWAICDATNYIPGPPQCIMGPGNRPLRLFPPTNLYDKIDFVYFVFYNLIAFLTISYAFTVLLERAQNIAGDLSGAGAPVANMTAGWGARGHGMVTGGKQGPLVQHNYGGRH